MKVLVTGGNGIVESAIIASLTTHGHSVRLISGVDISGVAEGCDAIIHAAEATIETPPEMALETTNINGTRRLLSEATRAGVRRFIYISSLGAQDGATDYHRSKNRAETLVREWSGDWTICRVGPVYGPGDRTVSLLVRMIRMMPVLPVLDDTPFQPVWASDLGEAIARLLLREDLRHRTLELAGPEAVTLRELVERISATAGKKPRLVPVPGWLAEIGLQAAGTLGLPMPIEENFLSTLTQSAAIPKGRSNALVGELGVDATPLKEGLARLVNDMPESNPGDGAGPLWRGRYRADITGTSMDAESLFEMVCGELPGLLGGAKVGPKGLAEGQVVSVPLPLRGDAQMRIEEIVPHRISAMTLEGQPFTGAMRILVEPRGNAVRFEIQTYERAANLPELLALGAGGMAFKRRTWTGVVEKVVRMSQGTAAAGVDAEEEALPDEQVAEVEQWMGRLVAARPREGTVPKPRVARNYGNRKANTDAR
jgi:nucleoside-diphosphate-sugar epimerase